MHSMMCLATEADSEEDALNLVDEFRNSQDWSDWNEVGGRWSDVLGGDISILRRSYNRELFDRTVKMSHDKFLQERAEILADVGHLTILDICSNPRYSIGRSSLTPREVAPDGTIDFDDGRGPVDAKVAMTESLSLWRTSKLLDMFLDRPGSWSRFFDMRNYSHDLDCLRERCKSNPDEQWISIIDFHH